MPWRSERTGRLLAGALAAAAASVCQAGGLRYCDDPPTLSAAQQDRVLRFAAVVRGELERSGARVALIARSGLDLSRFDVRYSHAGIALRASANGPWSVRQLYYACDEQRPRLYDQGLAGFLLGTGDPSIGYASLVLLPPGAEADALERAALDDRKSLDLLGADYSANAHAYAVRYQNCNQWVAELLGLAWGGLDGGTGARERAQRWLREQGYAPARFEVSPLLMLAGVFVPWVHRDDHPPEDLARGVLRISMPTAIDAFALERLPAAQRVELCHDGRRTVVRRGPAPIATGCLPADGDRVVAFD
jgi:hypothetical protein